MTNKEFVAELLFLSPDSFLKFFFRLFIWFFPLTFAVITFIDLNFSADEFSSSSILNDESVQAKLRISETKFRDIIFDGLSKNYSNKNFLLIDSITNDSAESNSVKNYIILNRLKNSSGKFIYDVPVNKGTTPLVELYNIKATLVVDIDKLNKILKISKNSTINEEIIKYGDYINTIYKFEKKIRYDFLSIAIFVIAGIFILAYFTNLIGAKKPKKDKLQQAGESLNEDKIALKEAEKILGNNSINTKEVTRLKKLVATLTVNANNYKFDNILKSTLFEDVSKAEQKSVELYNRSTLMLILGLLVALVGVAVFYFTLPEFNKIDSPSNYLALTIRPTLILIFIQSISFYLLRQYRFLILDFKYFHSEYLKKSKIFTTYQLMQNETISEVEMKLIDALLENKFDDRLQTASIEAGELDNGKSLEILKMILEKIK